jgi:hypothetical protein
MSKKVKNKGLKDFLVKVDEQRSYLVVYKVRAKNQEEAIEAAQKVDADAEEYQEFTETIGRTVVGIRQNEDEDWEDVGGEVEEEES